MIAVIASSLLVLHLDFNTIQMKEEAVVDCLREASALGYNAVLWEVENKVRWETCPECVDPEAFSKDEFRRILAEADRLGLEPIPLMQTFGHAEYVLRHEKYAGWRESQPNFACYCVSRPDVLAFQKALLKEYLDLFGGRVRRFHLGGDEALAFGTCPRCREFDKMDLYVRHLTAVSEELEEKGIRPGVWADMVLLGGDWRNHGKADVADEVMLKLPRRFTLWNWDYNYIAGPRHGRIAATPRLTKLGYEVILSTSSQSAMDSPFMPQFKAHRDNIAVCAADVRDQKLAGLCVTSWSVHLYPKTLQYPLWEFAARRFKDPSDNAEAEFSAIVRRRWGEVSIDAIDRMSVWDWNFRLFDMRSWEYEKRATPAEPGTLAKRLGKIGSGEGRRRIVDLARKNMQAIDRARRELGVVPQSAAGLRQLDAAGANASAFLDQLVAVLENRRADRADSARHDLERFYSALQTPRSAENSSRLIWSVLAQSVVPPTVYAQPEPVGLPPLMRTAAGGQVGSVREWEEIRRPEILKFAVENVYGVRPVERPADLRFEQIEPDRAFPAIKAVRRRARARFSGPRGKWSFEMTVFVPEAATSSAPAPAFVLICNRALEQFADIDLKTKSEFFPVEEIVSRGYAAAVFKNTDLALDAYHPYYAADGSVVVQDPPFTNGFYACWAAGRTERSWGAISAWAWGASRVLDWLETMPDVDAGRVAVVGHSRGGKASLWAAATDSRFGMACVNESGCCGAKLNSVALPLSETIQLDNNNNPHWFCRAYRQFNCRDAHLPFDQHWIAALVAPRLLYIASASEDRGAGPWGEFLTARHASPAWELYGLKGLVEDHVYGVEMPFRSGCVGYHLRQGSHDLNLYDWLNFIEFAYRHGWRGS